MDSLRLMGNRQFYDHMLQDILHHHQSSVVDEVDVTTLRDYMLVSCSQLTTFYGILDTVVSVLNFSLPTYSV